MSEYLPITPDRVVTLPPEKKAMFEKIARAIDAAVVTSHGDTAFRLPADRRMVYLLANMYVSNRFVVSLRGESDGTFWLSVKHPSVTLPDGIFTAYDAATANEDAPGGTFTEDGVLLDQKTGEPR